MKTICIIPARSGSKRIPGKNMRDFLGKPIINYPAKAACESRCFAEIVVATDCDEIKKWASDTFTNIYERRPENATDEAELEDVLYEVLTDGYRDYDYCCLLLPTAVFATSERIKEGYEIIVKEDENAVFPVIQFDYPPERALVHSLTSHGMIFLNSEHIASNSQDLLSQYHDAGQFYWINVDRFRMQWGMQKRRILELGNHVIIYPATTVQDIDTEDDWKLAEMKWRLMHDNA